MVVFCVADLTLRALTSEDWQDVVEIRIEALTLHSGLFCADLEQTRSLSKEEWCNIIQSHTSQVFGLFDGAKLVGISGIYYPEDNPTCARFVMSYIKAEYRGQSAYDLFSEPRLTWALSKPHIRAISISHRSGNRPVRSMVMKQGFKLVGTQEIDWPDGTRDTEYMYKLDLECLR